MWLRTAHCSCSFTSGEEVNLKDHNSDCKIFKRDEEASMRRNNSKSTEADERKVSLIILDQNISITDDNLKVVDAIVTFAPEASM